MASVAPLRVGPADHGRPMTLDEFREAEELGGYRYELARGFLEVSDIPEEDHGLVVWRLLVAFARDREASKRVWRYGTSGGFRLWLPGLVSARSPDGAAVLSGTPEGPDGRRPPSLAIEVVAPESQTRDYVTKREEYLAYGLREYWIVDPHTSKVTVLIREGDVWIEQVCQGDQPVPSLVLPGFAATVSELLACPEPDDPPQD
jgi:Uma2 family endonuclease